MQIDNLTANTYVLDRGYTLTPNQLNVVISDTHFDESTRLRDQLGNLLKGAKISIDTPPVGYTYSNGKYTPTEVHSGGASVDFRDSPAEGNNAAVVSTIAAPGAGKSNYLTDVTVGYSAAPAAIQVVQVESPSGTVIWKRRIATTSPFIWEQAFNKPIKGADNQVLIVRLPASGTAGVFGYVNQRGYTANT
jgi:hypothetical protein